MNSKYLQHKVFKELDDYTAFYHFLSFSVSSFVSSGVNAILNFESHIYSSMQGTLESIKLVLLDGKINDSYALLRKYHDSVIISSYAITYIQEHFDIEKSIVEKIDNWIQGREKLPRYEDMTKYLQKSGKLSNFNQLFNKDDRYRKIRSRCNNHMHYNMFYYMMINDKDLCDDRRETFLDELSDDIKNIFILDFIYSFSLNEHYMSSSDYVDYLDAGMEPVEGSQYLVAPIVQKMFDDYVKPNRPDVSEELKSKTCMQLG
jgi:hypothetical protein